MSQETDALLRTLLFQAMKAKLEGKPIDDVISAIRVMCSKDMIAAVKDELDMLAKND